MKPLFYFAGKGDDAERYQRECLVIWEPIRKSVRKGAPLPNLIDYEQTRSAFTWEGARRELDGLPGGKGLNIAHEAVDRHASGPRRDHVALRWIGKTKTIKEFTYADLKDRSNRFANVLRRLGIGPGDRVYALAGRIPELYIAALGTLKNRSVFCPLFSAFGPEPIRARMAIGGAKALVTTESLYRKKVAPIRPFLSELKEVLLIGEEGGPTDLPETRDLHRLTQEASGDFTIDPTDPEDPALLHFTSGTTGTPKGALHVHEAVVAHHITGKLALDFHPDDIFWCTADPGWVTGTSYGIIAPLTHGITSIVDEAEFDAERWYGILQDQKVTIWYTAPTAIRMMMKVGPEPLRKYDFGALRFLASVGEPLNPEGVVWGEHAFGLPFHDNWWQTETGGIMLANFAAIDIRPGSMGRPLPGIEAAVVHKSEAGAIDVIDEPGVQGELALRPGWPSMFRGYWNEEMVGGDTETMTSKRTKEEIRELVLKALGGIAPEADLSQLKPDVNFREQLDIDSMDLLNIMIALHQALKVEIPEADYPKLTTLNGAIDYLASLNEKETT